VVAVVFEFFSRARSQNSTHSHTHAHHTTDPPAYQTRVCVHMQSVCTPEGKITGYYIRRGSAGHNTTSW
jgi:hypothetical protein